MDPNLPSAINPDKPVETRIEPHERVINPPTSRLGKSHHIKQFFMGMLTIVFAILIGTLGYALGKNTPATPAKIQPTNPLTIPKKVTIVPTNKPQATPTAPVKETASTATTGDPMTTTRGKVTITTDKTRYKKGTDAIFVTIRNGLDQPIYATDELTNCTILSLQYLEDTIWKSITDCYEGRLPAIITTANQYGRTIKLSTIPLPPLPANDPNLFKPGIYRIALIYSISFNGPQFGGELIRPLTVYSPPFSLDQ